MSASVQSASQTPRERQGEVFTAHPRWSQMISSSITEWEHCAALVSSHMLKPICEGSLNSRLNAQPLIDDA